jgi:hypothetical protein
MPSARKPAPKSVKKKAARKKAAHAEGKARGAYVPAKHAGTGAGTKGAMPGAARSDKGAEARVAIDRLPEPARSLARGAERLIMRLVPGAVGVVKWGNAVYSVEGRAFAAVMQTRKGINLALPGAVLDDPHGLLEGTGKLMRHVKVHAPADLERAGLEELIVGAAAVGLKGL